MSSTFTQADGSIASLVKQRQDNFDSVVFENCFNDGVVECFRRPEKDQIELEVDSAGYQQVQVNFIDLLISVVCLR